MKTHPKTILKGLIWGKFSKKKTWKMESPVGWTIRMQCSKLFRLTLSSAQQMEFVSISVATKFHRLAVDPKSG